MRPMAFAALFAPIVFGAACGGRNDSGGVAADAGLADGDAGNSLPAEPVPLLDAGNEYLGLLTFDDAYVYAALFNPLVGDISCTWTGRWVRIAKDGSSSTPLGDVPTCVLHTAARADIVDDAIYWLDYPGAGTPAMATALMKLPKTGGTTTEVARFAGYAFDNFGTDGRSFFVTDIGSGTVDNPDGIVARIEKDGTMTKLAVQQIVPRWVGVTSTDVVWSTLDDCSIGNSPPCRSTTFKRASTAGGAPTPVGNVPAPIVYPTTVANGAVYFYDGAGNVRRLPLDGSAATSIPAPWRKVDTDRIRVSGEEIVATEGSNPYGLLGTPNGLYLPLIDNPTIEVDARFVYASSRSTIVKLAFR